MAHIAPKGQHGTIILGVDASRNRSGGAIAHIKGIVDGADPRPHGIQQVHLFGHEGLLSQLSDHPWLTKHYVPATKGSILLQLFWQRYKLPKIARKLNINAMFNTTASSVCPLQPSVSLSQDLLSFEPGEIQRYRWPSRARVRLEILKVLQLARLKRSTVAVFLTQHAAKVIGSQTVLKDIEIIPHGIDQRFSSAVRTETVEELKDPVHILYVSNAAPYKHQWHVVEGVAQARKRTGRDIKLRLVGGGEGLAQARLMQGITQHDPQGVFVMQIPFVPNDQIVSELQAADLFVFASSCENMPVTLLEAMAVGVPIASSDRGPMPEVLGAINPYFDPERPSTIADAIEHLLSDQNLRAAATRAAIEKAREFTWERSSTRTWKLLADVATGARKGQ